MTTDKAVKIARDLTDRIGRRVAATLPVVVQTADSDGNPVITFSADATPTTGEKIVVLRVKPEANTRSETSLGGAVPAPVSYGPHIIQICTEANYAGTNDSIADILTMTDIVPVLFEVSQMGAAVESYVSANGTAPATAQMTAANLKSRCANMWQGVLQQT